MSEEIEAVGAFATAGLAARTLEGRGAGHAGHDAACANCGAALAGPFCSACGQRGHVHRSLAHMAEEAVHGIAHFDGKVWRTLPLLAFKPGRLTRAYIDGRRAAYVSPMALFLFVVFLMFMAFSFTSHNNLAGLDEGLREGQIGSWKAAPAINRAFEDRASRARDDLAAVTAAGKDPTADAETVAAWEAAAAGGAGTPRKTVAGKTVVIGSGEIDNVDINIGIPGLNEAIRNVAKNPELLLYKLKNTAYKFSFLLVPISLPFIWALFFWRRDVRMYDHAVFALYSLSFMSLLFTLAALLDGVEAVPGALLGALVLIVPPVHVYKHLKYTYGLTRFGAASRTVLMMIFALVALALFASAILALGISG